MRVALVHYWIINRRGGERVLRAIADLFPEADIFAHVVDDAIVARDFPEHRVSTTLISRLPFARRAYQKYLPLMPMALEQLDLRAYDLVISSESGPAKGVIVAPHATHICYCHSPMRYAWDMYHEYRTHAGPLTRRLMAPLLHYMRICDQLSAQRVDYFVANSRFVARRIRKYYRLPSSVIYPPVAVEQFSVATASDDYYLSVGQLVAYKRPDLLVRAFNSSGKKLIVIGDGEMLKVIRREAKSNIHVLGPQSSESIKSYYAGCRALIMPGIEDFGIVPVEAMACGKPVIAFGAGGALETVGPGVSGIFFSEQTPESLIDAVQRFEAIERTFDPHAIREHAMQFSEQQFKSQFLGVVTQCLRDQVGH